MKYGGKLSEPLTRSLMKPIERFLKLADLVQGAISETRRQCRINFLIEIAM